jgi:hypothetical protein
MLLSDSHELFSTTHWFDVSCAVASCSNKLGGRAGAPAAADFFYYYDRTLDSVTFFGARCTISSTLGAYALLLMQGRYSGALTAARAWDTQSGRPLSRVPPLPTCSLKSAEPPFREMLAEY